MNVPKPLKEDDFCYTGENADEEVLLPDDVRLAAEWLKQRIRGTIQEELFMLRSDCKNGLVWTDQQIKDLAEASSIRLIDKSFGVVMKK